jgi:hypothetical protein
MGSFGYYIIRNLVFYTENVTMVKSMILRWAGRVARVERKEMFKEVSWKNLVEKGAKTTGSTTRIFVCLCTYFCCGNVTLLRMRFIFECRLPFHRDYKTSEIRSRKFYTKCNSPANNQVHGLVPTLKRLMIFMGSLNTPDCMETELLK